MRTLSVVLLAFAVAACAASLGAAQVSDEQAPVADWGEQKSLRATPTTYTSFADKANQCGCCTRGDYNAHACPSWAQPCCTPVVRKEWILAVGV